MCPYFDPLIPKSLAPHHLQCFLLWNPIMRALTVWFTSTFVAQCQAEGMYMQIVLPCKSHRSISCILAGLTSLHFCQQPYGFTQQRLSLVTLNQSGFGTNGCGKIMEHFDAVLFRHLVMKSFLYFTKQLRFSSSAWIFKVEKKKSHVRSEMGC